MSKYKCPHCTSNTLNSGTNIKEIQCPDCCKVIFICLDCHTIYHLSDYIHIINSMREPEEIE